MVSIGELSTNKGIIHCESKVGADRSRRFSRSAGTHPSLAQPEI